MIAKLVVVSSVSILACLVVALTGASTASCSGGCADDCGSGGFAGTGGSGGRAGGGPAPQDGGNGVQHQPVNDCNLALATDKRAEVMVQVTFSGSGYNPACIRVQEGTSVTFSGDFEVHPLVGGKVQGSAIPDPASPIPMTSIGMSVVATFPKAGDYGFYCANHYASRMMGAVFVDPASPPP